MPGATSFEAISTRTRWFQCRGPRRPISVGPLASEKESTTVTTISTEPLKELDRCKSATQAQGVMRGFFNCKAQAFPSPILYDSVKIPPGASVKGVSDGDLAIQTRLVNKKYAIMDLIALSGDRDADRASLAVVAVFISSSVAAGT